MEEFSTIGFGNPIVLSLDLRWHHHPDSPSFYKRINGVKIHRFKWETEPVGIKRII